ncbi:MAG: phenylacetate--CoA ligase family protein [Gammaproteobacteria bacterium]|nr:phenylacetate--CoA ligase family protein [Gammaproteobacteria bacterium]
MNLYQDVFFRSLDVLRGRRTIERLHFLRQSQHWHRADLRAWQLQRLNALLQQAHDHSDYYRRTLNGVRLPLTQLDALENIPLLTKTQIRDNFEPLQCRNIPRQRFVMSRTGGSTGEPSYYFWDKRGMDWNRASVYRGAEWAGVNLGERTVQMSGSHYDETQSQKLFNRIVYLLQRYRDYSVAVLTEELLERYYQGVRAWRPSSIWGYASGIHAFARYIQKHHPGASFDFLRGLFTSSETLRPEQRESINQVFGGAKVYDQYGSREMYMGSECREHNGYHLHAEVLLIEVVDKHNKPCRPGELGRLLITDLANHAFPFIRYEIGDVGVMSDDAPCACGITLPKLAKIEGRIADVVVLRDRLLTPPNFTILMSDIRGIKSYQIRQDSMDELNVYIVADSDYTEEVGQYVLSSIKKMAGEQVRVQLEKVAEIAVPESGKRRFIISSVSRDKI